MELTYKTGRTGSNAKSKRRFNFFMKNISNCNSPCHSDAWIIGTVTEDVDLRIAYGKASDTWQNCLKLIMHPEKVLPLQTVVMASF